MRSRLLFYFISFAESRHFLYHSIHVHGKSFKTSYFPTEFLPLEQHIMRSVFVITNIDQFVVTNIILARFMSCT